MENKIDEAFKVFHSKNPRVYQIFCKLAQQAVTRGKTKLSAKMLIEVVRWNYELETKGDERFKINNNFTSRYARLFITDHPDYSEIFVTRALISQH